MRNYFRKNISFCKLLFTVFIGHPTGVILAFLTPLFVIVIMPYLVNNLQNFWIDKMKDIIPENIPKPFETIVKDLPIMNEKIEFKTTLQQFFPGLLFLPTLITCLINIPMVMSNLKETKVLKKVKFLNISSLSVFICIVFSFLIIIFFSTITLFLVSKLFWWKYIEIPRGFSFLIPWFLMVFVSSVIGFTIGNFTKNTLVSFSIGVAFFLPTFFLSGIIFFQMKGWTFWLAQIFPQNHLVQLFKIAWFENDLFIHDYKMPSNNFGDLIVKIQIFNQNWKDTLIAYSWPLFCIFSLSTINVCFFRWE